MRFTKSARLLATAALAGSLGAGTVVALSSGPAGAAVEKSIVCKKLTGSIDSTITASGCSGNTGKSSQPITATALASGGTINWTNGKSTTIAAPTLTTLKPTLKCKKGNLNEGFKAVVTADTTGLAKLGTASGAVCIHPDDSITASKPLKVT